jgi:hypothetical protein
MLIQTTNFTKVMDLNDFDVGDSLSGRITGALFGFFLLAFGMPFTFVPVLIFGDGSIDLLSFGGLFMVLFTLPFVVAGLFVQFIGFSLIRLGIRPSDKKTIGRLNKALGNQSLDVHQEASRTGTPDVVVEEEGPSDQGENFWDTVES